ncbi:MAG: type II CAAX endopeptidase family protein [Verrucomicrobiota bacterium]
MPINHTILGLYFIVLLLGGITCLALDIKNSRQKRLFGIEPWSISTLEFFTFFVGIFAVQMLAAETIRQVFDSVYGDDLPWIYKVAAMTFAMYAGALVLYAFLRRLKPFQLTLSPQKINTFTALGKGVFYYLSAFPLVLASSLIWQGILGRLVEAGYLEEPGLQELVEQMAQLQGLDQWLLMGLLAVVGAPLIEELIYRGLLYRYLKSQIRPALAMALSAALFSAIHANLLQAVPLFVLGILLTRSYDRTGNLLVPIFFHACFNASTFLTLAIAPELVTE